MKQPWTGIGALFALAAVVFGAFGAHSLTGRIAPEHVEVFKTGAYYQMVHALALVLIGYRIEQRPAALPLTVAAWLLAAGIVLFSGSLYVLSLTWVGAWGLVTPIGGVAFIAGWAAFAIAEIGGGRASGQSR
ncbi:MAG TPA: DUF423 domain-containing protein [Chthonomonadaceae bacterium]|nr:DUF423 domain-containing protein [Chthonomonadaceae bacterium]